VPSPAVSATGTTLLPALTLPCLGDGPDVPLRKVTGVPTIVNFWATWCQPCQQEMPDVSRFAARRAQGTGPRRRHEDPSQRAALSFLVDVKAHYANVRDQDGQTYRRLGLLGIPGTVLVRADGSVALVHPNTVTYESLRQLVATNCMSPSMAEPPAWLRTLVGALPRLRAGDLDRFPPPDDARQSAVLMLLGEGPAGPDLLLIERSNDLRAHAGQPAFPGGSVDPTDDGPVGAALRRPLKRLPSTRPAST